MDAPLSNWEAISSLEVILSNFGVESEYIEHRSNSLGY